MNDSTSITRVRFTIINNEIFHSWFMDGTNKQLYYSLVAHLTRKLKECL